MPCFINCLHTRQKCFLMKWKTNLGPIFHNINSTLILPLDTFAFRLPRRLPASVIPVIILILRLDSPILHIFSFHFRNIIYEYFHYEINIERNHVRCMTKIQKCIGKTEFWLHSIFISDFFVYMLSSY